MNARSADTNKVIKQADRKHHFHNATNPRQYAEQGGMMITRAEGIYLYTDDGRKIIDAGSGLSNVKNVGSLIRLLPFSTASVPKLLFQSQVLIG